MRSIYILISTFLSFVLCVSFPLSCYAETRINDDSDLCVNRQLNITVPLEGYSSDQAQEEASEADPEGYIDGYEQDATAEESNSEFSGINESSVTDTTSTQSGESAAQQTYGISLLSSDVDTLKEFWLKYLYGAGSGSYGQNASDEFELAYYGIIPLLYTISDLIYNRSQSMLNKTDEIKSFINGLYNQLFISKNGYADGTSYTIRDILFQISDRVLNDTNQIGALRQSVDKLIYPDVAVSAIKLSSLVDFCDALDDFLQIQLPSINSNLVSINDNLLGINNSLLIGDLFEYIFGSFSLLDSILGTLELFVDTVTMTDDHYSSYIEYLKKFTTQLDDIRNNLNSEIDLSVLSTYLADIHSSIYDLIFAVLAPRLHIGVVYYDNYYESYTLQAFVTSPVGEFDISAVYDCEWYVDGRYYSSGDLFNYSIYYGTSVYCSTHIDNYLGFSDLIVYSEPIFIGDLENLYKDQSVIVNTPSIDLSSITSRLDTISALLSLAGAKDIIDDIVGDFDFDLTSGASDQIQSVIQNAFPFCIPALLKQVLGLMQASPSAPVFDLDFFGSTLTIDFNAYGLIQVSEVCSWCCRILFVICLLAVSRRFLFNVNKAGSDD